MSPKSVLPCLVVAVFAVLPLHAAAKTCSVAIGSNDAMQFDKQEIRIAADCTQVKLTLRHTGALPTEVMGHNWVLTTTADMQAAATDGMSAGLDKDYVKAGDARIIAHSKIIGGGETTSVTFAVSKLAAGTAYTYFCSFPGHWGIMKGTLALK